MDDQTVTALIVVVVIFVGAAVIWALAMFLSKAGTILIPIACGMLAAALTPKHAQGIVIAFIMLACVTLGILGSLSCYLLATLFDIEKQLAGFGKDEKMRFLGWKFRKWLDSVGKASGEEAATAGSTGDTAEGDSHRGDPPSPAC